MQNTEGKEGTSRLEATDQCKQDSVEFCFSQLRSQGTNLNLKIGFLCKRSKEEGTKKLHILKPEQEGPIQFQKEKIKFDLFCLPVKGSDVSYFQVCKGSS